MMRRRLTITETSGRFWCFLWRLGPRVKVILRSISSYVTVVRDKEKITCILLSFTKSYRDFEYSLSISSKFCFITLKRKTKLSMSKFINFLGFLYKLTRWSQLDAICHIGEIKTAELDKQELKSALEKLKRWLKRINSHRNTNSEFFKENDSPSPCCTKEFTEDKLAFLDTVLVSLTKFPTMFGTYYFIFWLHLKKEKY